MVVLITVLLILAALLFLLRPVQRDFGGLSELELQRYMAYATTALADSGRVAVRAEGLSAPVEIIKRVSKRRSTLTVRVSSGQHPRDAVQAVAEFLEKENVECRLTYSRKRRLPRWAEVTLPANDPFTPSGSVNIIRKMSDALGATTGTYSVCLGGPFRPGFLPTDGEVIPHVKSYRLSYSVGRWTGALLRVFRHRG